MAQELEDGEFWLPSDFLTDDDLLMDFKSQSNGFNSDLSSPIESVFGSAETESEEDDFVAGLTRKLAQSNFHSSNSKGFKLSSSPQSTLLSRKQGISSDAAGWDSPYSAADEVGRSRFSGDTAPFFSNPYPNPGFEAHLAYLRLQALRQMKQQQLMLMAMRRGRTQAPPPAAAAPPPAWPTLQQSQQKQKPGSGMRAVFLMETGSNKERTRAGTGVFLPQRTGSNPAETCKKPAYSTVLLPDRVIHALNMNRGSVNRGLGFYPDPRY